MKVAALKVEVMRQLLDHHELMRLIVERFEFTDSPDDRVRLSLVASEIARALDVDVSTGLRARVERAARAAGWTRVTTTSNIRFYRFMRPTR